MYVSKKIGCQWEFTHLPTDSQKAARSAAPFPESILHAKVRDLGLFYWKQDILLVDLVKGKSLFQSAVSNRCSDVQNLFSVIRDGSSNIMYTISKKISYTKRKKKITKLHSWLGECKTSAMFFGTIFILTPSLPLIGQLLKIFGCLSEGNSANYEDSMYV